MVRVRRRSVVQGAVFAIAIAICALLGAGLNRGDVLAAPISPANDGTRQPAAPDPLLDDLGDLNDLDADLLPGLEPDPPTRGERPAAGTDRRTDQPAPLDQPAEGEDIGAPGNDPFLHIGEKMRAAEQRISSHDTAEGTQTIQREILDEIDRLIAECQKQSQGQGNNGPRRSSQGPGSQNDGASTEGATGVSPQDSSQGVRPSQEATLSADQRQELARQKWGHLPERVMQQMQSLSGERFLSQYEELIDQYFKRLAEEDAAGP